MVRLIPMRMCRLAVASCSLVRYLLSIFFLYEFICFLVCLFLFNF